MRAKSSIPPQRWSAKRKSEIVLRLLRGEPLDALSLETGQPPAVLSQWREAFVEGGQRMLKRRAENPQVQSLEYERRRLQAKVGELMMRNEFLEEKIHRLESRPQPRRARTAG